MIRCGIKALSFHSPDLSLKRPCCQTTFPIQQDMPATSAPPSGSCSRFVPYFCRLLQCGQTPGTTGTAAACFDAESWWLCLEFAAAAMVAGFRWSSGVVDGLGFLRTESLLSWVRFHDWWWTDVPVMGHAIGYGVCNGWTVRMGPGPGWSCWIGFV